MPTRTQALLERCELDQLADRYPAQLSGGQQQRVALARAFGALSPSCCCSMNPSPTSTPISEVSLELGAPSRSRPSRPAALMVTHDDRAEAMALSDRVAVMSGAPGAILQQGPARGALSTPRTFCGGASSGEAMVVPARRSRWQGAQAWASMT